MEMSREEAEQAIMQKLREIRAIAAEYMGREPIYIAMCIQTGYISFNNSHWDEDSDKPLGANESSS